MIDELASGWRRTWVTFTAAVFLGLSTGGALSLEKQDVLDCEDIADVNRMIQGCSRVADEKQVPDQLRSMILVRRGFGYLTLHQVDAAVADFRQAVTLDPKSYAAYNELGLALQEKGDTEGAIAAMTEAVNLAPDSAATRFNRGNMFLRAGKLDDAIRDYGDAIELGADPNTVFAGDGQTERPVADRVLAGYFTARAVAHFLNVDFKQAISDYGRAAAFPHPEGYDAIWLYMAQKRAGMPGGDAKLESLLASEPVKAWPKPIAALMLGRMAPADVLAAAAKAVEICEAHFYIGEAKLAAGDSAGAKAEFTLARDTCPKTEREYAAAAIELARLK